MFYPILASKIPDIYSLSFTTKIRSNLDAWLCIICPPAIISLTLQQDAQCIMLKIKIIKILFGVSTCLLFVASCQRQTDRTLVELRSRLFENPDSVGLILSDLLPDYDYMREADKALFDLCRFQVASHSENFPPMENINAAISYFEKQKNTKYLIEAYHAKALYYKEFRDYEQANAFLLRASDLADKINYMKFSGRIYFELGHIAYMQNRYDSGLEYFEKAIEIFEGNNDPKRKAKVYTVSGMAALAIDEFDLAREYSFKALEITSDSITIGDLLNNIGLSYSCEGRSDSAYHYLYTGLQYPTISTNRSFRYYSLANLFGTIEQYDSVEYYSQKALELPIDIYVEEEIYRLLTEVALHRNDKEKAAEYIELRAQCNDSIKRVRYQPDITVVSRIHQSEITVQQQQSKQRYLFVGITLLVGIVLFLLLFSHKKKKEKKAIEQQHREALEQNEVVLNNLYTDNQKEQDRKINVFKAELNSYISSCLNEKSKSRSFMEKEQQRKNAYIEFLNIDKEELFIANMNYLLTSFPDKLKQQFKSINYKEIVWCCCFVLGVSALDVALIFNYMQTSQYKFKQRLIKKLQFSNTKEFEQYLSEMSYSDIE